MYLLKSHKFACYEIEKAVLTNNIDEFGISVLNLLSIIIIAKKD